MTPFSIINEIDPQVISINRSIKDKFQTFTTHKKDYDSAYQLAPLVDIKDSKYVINNYSTLKAIIRVLSVDTVFNEYNFNDLEGTTIDSKDLTSFWKRNKAEFKKAVDNHLGYGFGAVEVIFDEQGIPKRLKQIPVDTICIETKQFNGKIVHYCRYRFETSNNLYRITREDYEGIPDDDGSIGWVIWLGGDDESNWYDRPIWFPAYKEILTAISKKNLDFDNVSNGNIPKAVLLIKGPPDNPQEGELGVYDSVKEQFRRAGGGVAMAYLETPLDTDSLNVEYVKIQEDNYDYLNNLISITDTVLLELYRVPKIRLMIDDNKESLNSNKSQTLYEIYTLDLESYQVPYEEEIDIFTEKFWDKKLFCDMQTPIFVDNKAVQVSTIIEQYDVGILRLKDALKRISELYPEHNWEEIDWDDPTLNQRFYKGMLFTTPNMETGMKRLVESNLRGETDEGVHDSSDTEGDKSSANFFGR